MVLINDDPEPVTGKLVLIQESLDGKKLAFSEKPFQLNGVGRNAYELSVRIPKENGNYLLKAVAYLKARVTRAPRSASGNSRWNLLPMLSPTPLPGETKDNELPTNNPKDLLKPQRAGKISIKKMNTMKKLSILTALLFAAVSARADVKLNPIFDDHAVLQRDIPELVYGKAEPGEKVTLAFAGQTQLATTDKAGAWCVKLAAMKASTTPAVMTVSGKNKLTFNDVVVGDVWICSGQSNMDFTPGAYHNALDPKPYDEKDFDVPLLRQFHLINEPSMRPETEMKINRDNGTSEESAAWLPCKPTTGNRFTAAGLYFGRKRS